DRVSEPAGIDIEPLPAAVRELLDAYRTSCGAAVRLRVADGDGWRVVYEEPPGDGAVAGECETHVLEPAGSPPLRLEVVNGAAGSAAFLARALNFAIDHEREARSAARELTERYEEINLLYSISEILAAVMNVSDAATRILSEVADVLGARRASLWVYRPETGRLHLAAAVGEEGLRGPIPIDDQDSATAWVFREKQPLNLERGALVPHVRRLEPRPHGREAFLSVPISYTPPG